MLTLITRTITWPKLKKALYAVHETSCMILLRVAASNYFGAIFARLGTANMIAEWLIELPFPPTIMLPLVQKLGIDLIWFCMLAAVCLQTAWLSPPVALSAYFLKGVVPQWELSDIYRGWRSHDLSDRSRIVARVPGNRAVVTAGDEPGRASRISDSLSCAKAARVCSKAVLASQNPRRMVASGAGPTISDAGIPLGIP